MCQIPPVQPAFDLMSILGNPALPSLVGNFVQIAQMFDEYEHQESLKKQQRKETKALKNAEQTAIVSLFRLYQQGKLSKANFLELVGQLLPNDVDLDMNQLAMILRDR
jgi:hypothetical protein